MSVRDKLCAFSFLFASSLGFGTASAENAAAFQDCDSCPEMITVPAGTVTIGSYEDEAYRRKGERPKQTVTIAKPFALSKTETTLGMYREFVTATGHVGEPAYYKGQLFEGCNYFDGKGYGYVRNHNWENPGYPQREDEPVVCVSWSDAAAFAEWLSEKTGRSYRLPSTVEFEYAMRAGANTPWEWGPAYC